jgi:linoleoyl-CoA desaturase
VLQVSSVVSPAAATAASSDPSARKLKFENDSGFHAEIKRRVHQYFTSTGLSPRGSPRMYLKTAAILLWFGASYVALAFVAATWWQAGLAAVSMAFAVAGVGFSIQHDANHGAYSHKSGVNRLMGLMLDVVGASSYVWHWKHNVLHHTYPNMTGSDHDLDVEPFARLSPAQPRRVLHRWQQFYMWPIYGFMLYKWHFLDDFQNITQARIGEDRIPRPRGWKMVEMLAGKAAFFGWAIVVPSLFHRWWVVSLFYAGIAFLVGVVLSVVFQLAHCLEEAEFPSPEPPSDRIVGGWAAHQVHTTVDFARGNRLLTWYLGGLNFQVEHHLFPKICHVHYPRISPIVQTVCAEFGVRYAAHDGFFAAVSSHWRWLRRMGRAEISQA